MRQWQEIRQEGRRLESADSDVELHQVVQAVDLAVADLQNDASCNENFDRDNGNKSAITSRTLLYVGIACVVFGVIHLAWLKRRL